MCCCETWLSFFFLLSSASSSRVTSFRDHRDTFHQIHRSHSQYSSDTSTTQSSGKTSQDGRNDWDEWPFSNTACPLAWLLYHPAVSLLSCSMFRDEQEKRGAASCLLLSDCIHSCKLTHLLIIDIIILLLLLLTGHLWPWHPIHVCVVVNSICVPLLQPFVIVVVIFWLRNPTLTPIQMVRKKKKSYCFSIWHFTGSRDACAIYTHISHNCTEIQFKVLLLLKCLWGFSFATSSQHITHIDRQDSSCLFRYSAFFYSNLTP